MRMISRSVMTAGIELSALCSRGVEAGSASTQIQKMIYGRTAKSSRFALAASAKSAWSRAWRNLCDPQPGQSRPVRHFMMHLGIQAAPAGSTKK